jgi:hypothetical protein
MAKQNPRETFKFSYGKFIMGAFKQRSEEFTFDITKDDVKTNTDKSAAITKGIKDNIIKPANLNVTDLKGSVKVEATGGYDFTRVDLTLLPGRDKDNKPFQLGEHDVINPKEIQLGGTPGALTAALSLSGGAVGGHELLLDIEGPGGTPTPIIVTTSPGDSAYDLFSLLATKISSETSFAPMASGQSLLISGLTKDNAFGAALDDPGFSTFTESLSVAPEPSSLAIVVIGMLCILARALTRPTNPGASAPTAGASRSLPRYRPA